MNIHFRRRDWLVGLDARSLVACIVVQ